MKNGLIIINTGLGKGKTTAALGTILRAWGHGMRVCVIQFIKGEKDKWGEIKAAKKMGIEWHVTGDGFTWLSKDIDATIARAHHGWDLAQKKIASDNYDLILLDEFTYPLHYNWLDTGEVIRWLSSNKPPDLHLIITGRFAPEQLIEFADLVTDMALVKHTYEDGVTAMPGIEY